MWQLLLPLALGLGSMGLGRAELTAAQHRGLQVALEEFHKHPPVQWAFQVTSVDNASDTVSASPVRGGRDGDQETRMCPPPRAGAPMLGPQQDAPLSAGPAACPCPRVCCWEAGTGHTSTCSAGPRASLVCWQLFPAGQFVRLEFKLQQTSCRKKDWRKADCKVKPNGVS